MSPLLWGSGGMADTVDFCLDNTTKIEPCMGNYTSAGG